MPIGRERADLVMAGCAILESVGLPGKPHPRGGRGLREAFSPS
jgi:hypothetical protein